MDQGKTNCKPRRGEIDALRGLAVLLMVFSHVLRWVFDGDPATLIPLGGLLTPGDLATPMFYLAAGLSLYFSLQEGLQKYTDPLSLRRRFVVRLGKLCFVGVCMSLTWGVLQAQAVTLVMLVWLFLSVPRLQDPLAMRLYLPGVTALALSLHLLCSGLYLPPFWHRLLADQFPLFAILALNAAGLYLAANLHFRNATAVIIILGLFFSISALPAGTWGLTDMQRNGAPLDFLLLGTGLSMVLLGFFRFHFLQKTIIFSYLLQVGRDALFLFVLHYAAFFLPLYLWGFTGKLPAPAALVFASVLSVTVILVARLRRDSSFVIYDLVDLILLTAYSYLVLPLTQGLAAVRAYIFVNNTRAYPRAMGLRRQQ